MVRGAALSRGELLRNPTRLRRRLTDRQAEVLAQIQADYATMREPVPVALVARQLGIGYTGAVHHIEVLYEKGYLDRAGSPVRPTDVR